MTWRDTLRRALTDGSQAVDLGGNGFGAAGVMDLAEMLKHNKTLTTMNLAYNDIGAAGVKDLAEMLKHNKTLTTMDLSHNDIGAAGVKDLAEMLKHNTTLTTMDLSDNDIGAAGAKDLAEMLKHNKTLTTMCLAYNSFGPASAKALTEMLKHNKTLTTMNLEGNNLGPAAAAKDLAEMLKHNKTLQQNKIEDVQGCCPCTNGAKIIQGIFVLLVAGGLASWSSAPLEPSPLRFDQAGAAPQSWPAAPMPPSLTPKSAGTPLYRQVRSAPTRAGYTVRYTEPRHALVIGNRYQGELHLEAPAHDAETMTTVLSTMGFEVEKVNDADQATMRAKIDEFLQRIQTNPGLALFYFSGHGVSTGGTNYLIPQTIPNGGRSRDFTTFLDDFAVKVNRVTDALEKTGSIGVLILDACRTQQLPGWPKPKGGEHGLARIESRGLYVAFAASVGQAAWAGEFGSRMSTYTHHLVSELQKPSTAGIGLHDIFHRVKRQVHQHSSKKQLPYMEDHLLVNPTSVHLKPRPEAEVQCPTQMVLPLPGTNSDLDMSLDELARSVYMALLASEIAYKVPAERPGFLEDQHSRTFSRYLSIKQESEHVVMLEVATSNTVIVAYRGTTDVADVITDIQFPASPVLGGRVHSGFYSRSKEYDSDLPLSDIVDLLVEGKRVVLTGHSLGGATAIVNTLRILSEQKLGAEYHGALACITFGSPLLGDKALQKQVRDNGYARHFFTYVYETDIVPRLLLLQKGAQQQLHNGLKGMNFYQMAEEKATEYLTTVFVTLLGSYIGRGGAQVAAEATANAAAQFGKWAWDEVNPDYFPFGAYLFYKDGEVQLAKDGDMIQNHMQAMWTPDVNSVMNHKLDRYSGSLEALRVTKKA